MAQLEDALRIRHFRRLPSSEEFSAEIEPSNVPAVRETGDSNIPFIALLRTSRSICIFP
ncbi:hypothetical protein MA16_Dca024846 [Dendrobium catenatum]|uniref:Uncharacterized protein n=1 Tax=Dendrobium catenatum TaxID=906689 RepID=A0A2I0V6L8_9ASPA|nr:hypothetical protein MA16_Dca024846 [Dendrobium catenatum]